MQVKQKLAFGALVAWPFVALAQNQVQPNPLAATDHVPAVTYVSTFENYQSATDSQASPDQGWRAANDTVAKLGGHAGHMSGSTKVASTTERATPLDKPRFPSQMVPMQTDHSAHRHH